MLAMQESRGDDPRWREQLMLRPRGRGLACHMGGTSARPVFKSLLQRASRDRQGGPHHRVGFAFGCM